MEWMDKLKKVMYSDDVTFDTRCDINDIIYTYDKERAKTPFALSNAGINWQVRLTNFCDYLANKEA